MPRTARIALITAGLTVLAAAGLELGLRFLLPQGYRATYASGSAWGVPDSVLGMVPAPGTDARVACPEFSFRFRINGQGFRDEAFHAPGVHPDSLRVLLVGDSFTFGAGSEYEAIWPVRFEARLQEAIPGAQVVKAGVLGYDTRTEVLYLERLLPVYRPDVVVLGFLPNDLFTNRPLDAVEPPAGGGASVLQTVRGLQMARLASRILLRIDPLYERIYLMTPRRQYYQTVWPPHAEDQAAVTRALLRRAHELCRSYGAAFLVLSIPQEFQVLAAGRGDRWDGIDPGRIDAALGAFAEAEGFPWIPTLPALAAAYREHGPALYYRSDGHLAPAGNRQVAEVVFREFMARYPEIAATGGAGTGGPPPQ